MTQNYKPAYPPEFRQQMVELLALGKCPKPQAIIQGIGLPLHFDTNLVSGSRCTHEVKPGNCFRCNIECYLLECQRVAGANGIA